MDTMDNSKFLNDITNTPTKMPVLNLALSGELDKGISSGVTAIAGPSKHFKSNLALLIVKSYLDAYPDSVCLFCDNEFGITEEYISSMGIDPSRMVHYPFSTVEELRNELSGQIDGISRGDKLIIMIDSIGNVASQKEVSDATADKSASDMGSRAKAIKSLFRIITAKATLKDVPIVAINHSYSQHGLFPKEVMSGGTGIYYSANTVLMLTRAQEKQGTDIAGYTFTIKVDKSRKAREGSKVKFTALFDKGILLYSGLLDIALATGHVIKPSVGWYAKASEPDKKYREKEIHESADFWKDILEDDKFKQACRKIFKLENLSFELEGDIDLTEFTDDEGA